MCHAFHSNDDRVAGEREAVVLSLTNLQKLRLEQPRRPQGMQAWWVGWEVGLTQ